MNRLSLQGRSPSNRSSSHRDRVFSGISLELLGITNVDCISVQLTVTLPDSGFIGIAQHRRRLYKRAKHELQIECRTADNFQDVSGRGLPLQGLRKLASARLYFIEEAGIFDRNDGLVGECHHQLDLLLCKRRNSGPAQKQYPVRLPWLPIKGTPRIVRYPAALCSSGYAYSGSASTSEICTGRASSKTRPTTLPRPGGTSVPFLGTH